MVNAIVRKYGRSTLSTRYMSRWRQTASSKKLQGGDSLGATAIQGGEGAGKGEVPGIRDRPDEGQNLLKFRLAEETELQVCLQWREDYVISRRRQG